VDRACETVLPLVVVVMLVLVRFVVGLHERALTTHTPLSRYLLPERMEWLVEEQTISAYTAISPPTTARLHHRSCQLAPTRSDLALSRFEHTS